MKKFLLMCGMVVLCSFTPATKAPFYTAPNGDGFPSLLSNSSETATTNHLVDSIYQKINLDSAGLQRDVFFDAYKGYEYLLSKGMLRKTNLLTICDYSQSSHNKRLYVIDLEEGKILFNTYVSHGKNSGGEYATSFSNKINSEKSSLGFLVTAETYRGKAGYSMHLDGVEPGINDKVRQRSIVMHGSWYVNEKRADEGTLMGRSFGCPAVPYGQQNKIIDEIKNGSCFFIYNPDNFYAHVSRILNAQFVWPDLQQTDTAPAEQNTSAVQASTASNK
jgi:hypothetical protein